MSGKEERPITKNDFFYCSCGNKDMCWKCISIYGNVIGFVNSDEEMRKNGFSRVNFESYDDGFNLPRTLRNFFRSWPRDFDVFKRLISSYSCSQCKCHIKKDNTDSFKKITDFIRLNWKE